MTADPKEPRVGDRFRSRHKPEFVLTVRFVDDDGWMLARKLDGEAVSVKPEVLADSFVAVPPRYVVEVRLPKKGERLIGSSGRIYTAPDDRFIEPVLVVVEEGP